MRKIVVLVMVLSLIAPGIGLCFEADNSHHAGTLRISPGYEQAVSTSIINRDGLDNLRFYDRQVTAENAAITINTMEIAVEAHNYSRQSWEAAQMTGQNVNKIWLCVERLQAGQSRYQYYDASKYRLVHKGKTASVSNQMVIEFTKLNLVINPGEKVMLSFFGSFYPYLPAGTIIKGEARLQSWQHTAKAVRYKDNGNEHKYLVQ